VLAFMSKLMLAGNVTQEALWRMKDDESYSWSDRSPVSRVRSDVLVFVSRLYHCASGPAEPSRTGRVILADTHAQSYEDASSRGY
jgi:hypothetical protein